MEKYKLTKLYILLFTIIITISGFTTIRNKNCDDAKDSAQNAYNYYKKAYRSDKINDLKYYAKKGMNESLIAENDSNKSDCKCDNAESSSNDAYSYGKKAYNSSDFDDAQRYIKKAIRATEEIISYAENCEK